MGQRTVKRVPLDFGWPIGEVWQGYEPPDWRPCPAGDDCINGSTRDGAWLGHWVHILLVAAGSPDHPWVPDGLYGERPTGAIREVTEGLAGRFDSILGHDAIDRWKATKAVLRAAGVGEEWGICPSCQGHALHPDDVAASEVWEGEEPPTGEGWQLWETTSEGSPVSPVFATADDLADWCSVNATLFASQGASREQWLRMFTEDTVDVGSMMVFQAAHSGETQEQP